MGNCFPNKETSITKELDSPSKTLILFKQKQKLKEDTITEKA